MKLRHGRRVAALFVMGCVAVGSLVVAANAESTLDAALSSRQDLHGRIKELHDIRNQKRVTIHKRIRFYQERIEAATKAKVGVDRGYEHWKKKQVKAIERLRAEEKAVVASIRGRVTALREQRATLADWIEALPLQRCPVDGPVDVSDNFGDVRDMPGTPYHIHQGNDMMAATGTPIVAPFDGTAVANPANWAARRSTCTGWRDTCTTPTCRPTASWARCTPATSSATWVPRGTPPRRTTTSNGTRTTARRSIPTIC